MSIGFVTRLQGIETQRKRCGGNEKRWFVTRLQGIETKDPVTGGSAWEWVCDPLIGD